jgi:hypothetical protein
MTLKHYNCTDFQKGAGTKDGSSKWQILFLETVTGHQNKKSFSKNNISKKEFLRPNGLLTHDLPFYCRN